MPNSLRILALMALLTLIIALWIQWLPWAQAADLPQTAPVDTPAATSTNTRLPTLDPAQFPHVTFVPTIDPIVALTPDHLRVPTPWPTMAPRPVPTRRPGHNIPAVPIRTPPADAAGEIWYMHDGPMHYIPVDGAGKATGPAVTFPIPYDLILPRSLSEAVPSPDRRYLLLQALGLSPDAGAVYLYDLASGEAHLIPDVIADRFHGWHPDSRHILTSSTSYIQVINVETGTATILHKNIFDTIYEGAAFSPDGQQVAFETNGELWISSSVGGDAGRVPGVEDVHEFFGWSPDGQYVYYRYEGQRILIKPDGSDHRTLSGPGHTTSWGSTDYPPKWAPDGRWIAYTGRDEGHKDTCTIHGKNWTPSPYCWFDGAGVYIVNVESGEVQRLASGIDPVWSPDSSMLVYRSIESGEVETWVIGVDGSGRRRLFEEGKGHYPIQWLPAREAPQAKQGGVGQQVRVWLAAIFAGLGRPATPADAGHPARPSPLQGGRPQFTAQQIPPTSTPTLTPTPWLAPPFYSTKIITQRFKAGHPAVDFAMRDQVLAAASGKVTKVTWASNTCHNYPTYVQPVPTTHPEYPAYRRALDCGWGLYIEITHGNGYRTRYAHLSAAAFPLGEWDSPETSPYKVSRGQVIGMAGSTGWSTAPHLHFELILPNSSARINPTRLWEIGQNSPSRNPIPTPSGYFTTTIDDDPISVPWVTRVAPNNAIVPHPGFLKGYLNGDTRTACNTNCTVNGVAHWTQETQQGSYNDGDMYWTKANATPQSYRFARWTLGNAHPEDAVYEIFARIPMTYSTSWQAPYQIRKISSPVDITGTITSTVGIIGSGTVDQYGFNIHITKTVRNTNQWASLGWHLLSPYSYVETNSNTGEAQSLSDEDTENKHCPRSLSNAYQVDGWCRLGVDALQFVRRSGITVTYPITTPILLKIYNPTRTPSNSSDPAWYYLRFQNIPSTGTVSGANFASLCTDMLVSYIAPGEKHSYICWPDLAANRAIIYSSKALSVTLVTAANLGQSQPTATPTTTPTSTATATTTPTPTPTPTPTATATTTPTPTPTPTTTPTPTKTPRPFVASNNVYLPYLDHSSGRTSSITIRNNTTSTQRARITYIRTDGSTVSSRNKNALPANATWSINPPSRFKGAALIESSGDISAVVLQGRTRPYAIDSYTGIENPTNTVHVPLLQRDNSSWRSDIYIQNTSSSTPVVNVNFYPPFSGCQHGYGLSGKGWVKVNPRTVPCFTAKYGTAYIHTDQPIAVVSTQYTTNGRSLMITDNHPATASTIYAPLVQNGNNGWIAGINVQSGTTHYSTLSATLRRQTGRGTCTRSKNRIAYYGHWTFYPVCDPGSRIASGIMRNTTSARYVAANVNQIKNNNTAPATTYPAISASNSHKVILPRVQNKDGWTDAFTVYNVSTSSNRVTVHAYDADGNALTVSGSPFTLQGQALRAMFVPTNTSSVVLTSTRPIVAEANNWKPRQSGDHIGSYAGIHR